MRFTEYEIREAAQESEMSKTEIDLLIKILVKSKFVVRYGPEEIETVGKYYLINGQCV